MFESILPELLQNRTLFMQGLATLERSPLVHGKYLHWDELIRRSAPQDMDHKSWWGFIKFFRQPLYKSLPLQDSRGYAFKYAEISPITEFLHHADLGAGGGIEMPDQITNPDTRDRYYVNSLIEEAITSSQLEGATTTHRVAEDMIRSGRDPRDKSERMILNNFLTMKYIAELKNEPLSPNVVHAIHRRVSDQTLDEPDQAGRFRRVDEDVFVTNIERDEILHVPPPTAQLPSRMEAMCDFANGKTPSGFLHPVVRSIILHFWLAYDHPFVDGNGRTARALFYWSMLKHGYWLFEFVSISRILRKAPVKYGRAFLYTETDDNDLTYFLLHQLTVIDRAIKDLHSYIEEKTQQTKTLERKLRGLAHLNHRQRAIVSHALRHPHHEYTIASHQMSHGVAYQTARTDLLNLASQGLLSVAKVGQTQYFSPVPELERKLRSLA
jgi:Fic family protein